MRKPVSPRRQHFRRAATAAFGDSGQGLARLPEDRALPGLHAGLSLPLLHLSEEMLWAALRMGRCLRLGALYPARAERRAGLLRLIEQSVIPASCRTSTNFHDRVIRSTHVMPCQARPCPPSRGVRLLTYSAASLSSSQRASAASSLARPRPSARRRSAFRFPERCVALEIIHQKLGARNAGSRCSDAVITSTILSPGSNLP